MIRPATLALSLGLLAAASVSPGHAAPLQTLTAQMSETIRAAGLDPDSAAVRAAVAEGEITVDFHGDPETFSLAKLAAGKKLNGIRNFVGTRAFLRALKADPGKAVIFDDTYNPDYLSNDERALVSKRVAADIAAGGCGPNTYLNKLAGCVSK